MRCRQISRLVRRDSIIHSPPRPLSFSLERPQVLLESHPLLCLLELSVIALHKGQVECVVSVNNLKAAYKVYLAVMVLYPEAVKMARRMSSSTRLEMNPTAAHAHHYSG
jgi:hypothetical protein